jgi:hypothetical protein
MNCINSDSPFWFESLASIFWCSPWIPEEDSSLAIQWNALTRLVVLVWIVLAWTGSPYAHRVGSLALLTIILLYYLQTMNSIKVKESFCPSVSSQMSHASHASTAFQPMMGETLPVQQWNVIPAPNQLKIQAPSQYRFCQDQRPISEDARYPSSNQALANAGATTQQVGNPLTWEQPVIISPPAATDYWSAPTSVPQGINAETHTEMVQSGYIGSSPCGFACGPSPSGPVPSCASISSPSSSVQQWGEAIGSSSTDVKEGFQYTRVGAYPPMKQASDNVANYDHPEQLKHFIPSNLPVGKCSQSDAFNTFHKNLFTTPIEPGVYERIERIQPISSNLGVTYASQYDPVTCQTDSQGNTLYIANDPSTYQAPASVPTSPVPTNENVYDPRYTGYGTSYRAYIDEMSGQPRYYYDDVDAVRRPNFLIRSRIDDAPWAQSYGAIQQRTLTSDLSMESTRTLAHEKFIRDTSQQRADLQERAMNKYNTEISWQRRYAPLRGSQFASAAYKS